MERKVEIDKSLVLESTSRVLLLLLFFSFACFLTCFVLFVFVLLCFCFLLFRLDESSHNVSLQVKID